ncbi:MAG: LacI family DNA-binding transcriptional regulator, partial [Steroidobacter sp.]
MDVGQKLQRPTITTVAAQARVSIKTVSRVLNNSAAVTPATRDHVMEVMRQLSYRPSPTARTLAGHPSLLIGMPFDSSASRYVTEVQMGTLPTLRAANYQVVMHACDAYAADVVDEIVTFIQRVRVDGIILTPPLSHMETIVEALVGQGVPFVKIGSPRRADFARNVFTNERDACADMVAHLAGGGHTRIAFVAGPAGCTASEQRYLGYLDGLKQADLPLLPTLVKRGANTVASGMACGRELLVHRRDLRPTAIFASNDDMAAGVLRAAHDFRIHVPTELSVAGFEDSPIASQIWPKLTTIRQPIGAMAERAAALLMDQLRSGQEHSEQHPGMAPQVIESSLI